MYNLFLTVEETRGGRRRRKCDSLITNECWPNEQNKERNVCIQGYTEERYKCKEENNSFAKSLLTECSNHVILCK